MIMLLVAFFFYYGDANWIWWTMFGIMAVANFVKFCRDMA
jgi:hypothetical protein